MRQGINGPYCSSAPDCAEAIQGNRWGCRARGQLCSLTPALFTSASSLPKLPTACSTACEQLSSAPRSANTKLQFPPDENSACNFSPCSASRSTITTFALSAAHALTIAAPIPFAPSVTRITFLAAASPYLSSRVRAEKYRELIQELYALTSCPESRTLEGAVLRVLVK